jgi:hypothetical protein
MDCNLFWYGMWNGFDKCEKVGMEWNIFGIVGMEPQWRSHVLDWCLVYLECDGLWIGLLNG